MIYKLIYIIKFFIYSILALVNIKLPILCLGFGFLAILMLVFHLELAIKGYIDEKFK